MDNLTKTCVTLFCIGAFLALMSTLAPWTAETFGDAEENIQAKLDAESCPSTDFKYTDDVLYYDYKGRLVKPESYKRLIK